MQITFYQNNSDDSAVPKNLNEIASLTGSFRESVDILNPVFTVTSATTLTANYCYIPEFSRYYFCEISVLRTGIYQITAHVDALQSWFNYIKQCPAIIDRTDNAWNAYIPDSERKFFQYKHNQYITIGDVGIPKKIVMLTVG